MAVILRSTLNHNTLVATDRIPANLGLNSGYPHEAVSHSTAEYVRGQVRTNNLDSFWSLLKRGMS